MTRPDDRPGAGAPTTQLADADNRATAVHPDGATVFLSAGAGTGKTKTLVDAIVGLLADNAGLRLPAIAAVTFTEKAAAELKGRLRIELVGRRDRETDASERARWTAILADLDLMRIGTIHSFALAILREFPLEAGCPPEVNVMDDAAIDAMLTRLWADAIDALTGGATDQDLARTMYRTLGRRDALRDIVRSFVTGETARLRPAAPRWEHPRADELRAAWAAHSARKWRGERDYGAVVEAIIAADFDELACLPILTNMQAPTAVMMSEDDPSPIAPLLVDLQTSLCDLLLRRWLAPIAGVIDQYRDERVRTGELMFNDIIDLAHALLTDTATTAVRARLRAKIRHVFVDEFQDTDVRQVGIVTSVLAQNDTDLVALTATERVPRVRPGSLFVVGDRLQSIYGFRGADVRQYERVRNAWEDLTGTGQVLDLTTNFRTEPALVDWFNDLFSTWFADTNRANGGYRDLTSPPAWRSDAASERGYGPLVTALDVGPRLEDPNEWRPHHVVLPDNVDTATARAAEAEAVVTTLAAATGLSVLAGDAGIGREPRAVPMTQPWQAIVGIDRQTQQPVRRAITPGDCAILVPTKTGIAALLRELRRQGLPFRVQGSALLHQTPQIIEIARIARAIADPTDEIALVEALRTSLLGCRDSDLYEWSQVIGRHRWTARYADDEPHAGNLSAAVTRVRDALDRIGNWRASAHDAVRLIEKVLADTPAFDIAEDWEQASGQWGAYTFLLDETRAWQDTTGGSLSAYTDYLESLIDPESKAPDTNVVGEGDAIEVMTIHQSKGLTFPVVALWGLSSRNNARSDAVVVTSDGEIELSIRKPLQTAGIQAAREAARIEAKAERERLWYVAFTRARSHVIMAACRSGGAPSLANQVGGPVYAALADARTAAIARGEVFDWATTIERGPALAAESGKVDESSAAPTQTRTGLPPIDQWRKAHARALANLPAQTYETVTDRAHGNAAPTLPGYCHRGPVTGGENGPSNGHGATVTGDFGASEGGTSGSSFGTAVHLALQLAHAGFTPEEAAAKATAESELTADSVQQVARFAASCQVRLDELALQPGHFWFEVPVADFAPHDPDAVPSPGLIGIADFVYEAAGAIHVLDFKTDRTISATQRDAYLQQVETYRDIIAIATGLTPGTAQLCHAKNEGPADLIG